MGAEKLSKINITLGLHVHTESLRNCFKEEAEGKQLLEPCVAYAYTLVTKIQQEHWRRRLIKNTGGQAQILREMW